MSEDDLQLEIGHVLFVDIVGYSKRVIDDQRSVQRELNEIVRSTDQFKISDAKGKLVRLPTGDGMALVFRDELESPARCAMQIAREVNGHAQIPLRMGIHSGPVSDVTDVNERANVAGDGVNIAQRIMDCGDAGHILMSKRVADDLANFGRWRSRLHDLGDVEVKHGVKIGIFNLCDDGIGNHNVPEKIARTRKRSRARRRIVMAGAAAVGALAIALSIFAYQSRRKLAEATSAANAIFEKSVAVLPFENLSDDPKNAFLSTGIQDEILTRLAKIAALKVISRSSTKQYESRPANLAQVAKELGAAAILEGTVQKVGHTIRVNVQLIKAATDTHLWAETYDRELIDVLEVESDVATAIAAQLRATLNPEEKTRVERRPTNNAEAYALYLKARDVELHETAIIDTPREAQSLYEQALKLDPDFALAHARLSMMHAWMYGTFEQIEAHRVGARLESEQALRLQPDLGEAHLARATYLKVIERDLDGALQSLTRARELLPNNVEVLATISAIRRRQGHWKEAIADAERAASLNPRDAGILDQLGNSYISVKRWADAERVKRKAMELNKTPPEAAFGSSVAWVGPYWALTGDLGPMHKIVDDLPPGFDPGGLATQQRFETAMIERDYAAAERAIVACKSSELNPWGGVKVTKNFYLGRIALAQGDVAKAKRFLESELELAQAQATENPDAPVRRAHLGLLLAYLGRKEEAIREGKRAVELLPESKDAYEGVDMASNLAQIYAWVGERDEALKLIERLLRTPTGLFLLDLRTNWIWDPLRDDPRFQKILASPDPPVVFN